MSKQQKLISKSRFVAALHCPKRCWLEHHEPLPYEDKTDPLIQMGNQIGELAQTLFPNGVLIDEKPWQRVEAEERTARLMNDESVNAIFEGAFSSDGIAVRVDILERCGDCWNILEVKSSTSCKDSHIWDIGLQERVVSSAGVSVGTSEMMLVDTSYVLSSDGLDSHKLLKRLDVSDKVDERRQQIEDQLEAHRNILACETCPDIEPAFQCQSPWSCDYLDQCTDGFPDDWIINLPRINEKKVHRVAPTRVSRCF